MCPFEYGVRHPCTRVQSLSLSSRVKGSSTSYLTYEVELLGWIGTRLHVKYNLYLYVLQFLFGSIGYAPHDSVVKSG